VKLSTRVRYGVRAMIELAKQPPGQAVPLRVLARNQTISPKYLEQMAAALKIAGLIESVRGAEGGYRLTRPPEHITVWDIYRTLDVAAEPIDCLSRECQRLGLCAASELWGRLSTALETILKSHNLKQLAEREQYLQLLHHPAAPAVNKSLR